MNYYLIFLLQGKVVDICSYDDEPVRDEHYDQYANMEYWQRPFVYDEVQTLNQVK
jgi:hypothetical protein